MMRKVIWSFAAVYISREYFVYLEKFPLSEFGEMQSIYVLNYLIENVGLNAVNLEDENV